MEISFAFNHLLLTGLLLTTLFSAFVRAENSAARDSDLKSVVEKTQILLGEIVEKSFPELRETKIKVKTFKSQKNYFKARFAFSRFLTFRKMQTIIFVNPLVFERNAPAEGIRAILAHELAHALYYNERNRLKLFGLIGLIDGGFEAQFERNADLVAVYRGYGEGLIIYRNWLYQNVPADDLKVKKRNYFTPDELKVLTPAVSGNLSIFEKLKKNVPRNLSEVEKALN
ncbi:MAG TPA: hypothetical protein PKE69_10965 [Pyrinomonadaceae bacterium]|nr:hypothetical protein [Pyrinomonadaceae bacterium]